MKWTLLILLMVSAITIGLSCKKELTCEGCSANNKPLVAYAGPDELIVLPTDSTSSHDPDIYKKTEIQYQLRQLQG